MNIWGKKMKDWGNISQEPNSVEWVYMWEMKGWGRRIYGRAKAWGNMKGELQRARDKGNRYGHKYMCGAKDGRRQIYGGEYMWDVKEWNTYGA
jgi:hypothetical protein